jgi:hypothetical protein
MLVVAFVAHHDHEPHIEYVDTDKLDQDDFLDMELLKAVQAGEESLYIDASNWEDHPDKFPSDDIGISAQANIEKPDKLDAAIMVNIDFDC